MSENTKQFNPSKIIPRHIIVKLSKVKDKDRILKATRKKKQITHKGAPICLAIDFSMGTTQAKREGEDIFKVLKEKSAMQKYCIL